MKGYGFAGTEVERKDCMQMLFSTATVEMCCPVNNEEGEAESEAVGPCVPMM